MHFHEKVSHHKMCRKVHNAWVQPLKKMDCEMLKSLWQTSCLWLRFTSCVFLVICVRFCTDLLPSGSSAAGYIHIRLVGQVPAYRSCNQRTKRHFTHTHTHTHTLEGFPLNITDLMWLTTVFAFTYGKSVTQELNHSIVYFFMHVAFVCTDKYFPLTVCW